jgi:hypothetical protein
MTSPISQLTAMSGNSKVIMSPENHSATEDVKLIRKTKFPAKVLLWLAVNESGISEPVFSKPVLQSTKKCTYSNVYQFFIKLSKNITKMKKSCSNRLDDKDQKRTEVH